MGGPSGPTLLFQVMAIRAKSIGPEGPSHEDGLRAIVGCKVVVGGPSGPILLFQAAAVRFNTALAATARPAG
ncbi:DUF6053 domain-containing protein [Lysobacter enzymogenes]|uniref:DUF6053 domain-containing protein n=1 Tax=Lysobacter enzymogenes TaxID=69 RepID=UPI003D18D507